MRACEGRQWTVPAATACRLACAGATHMALEVFVFFVSYLYLNVYSMNHATVRAHCATETATQPLRRSCLAWLQPVQVCYLIPKQLLNE